MNAISRLDYCQFLLSSQINYTMTYFADHVKRWSHDTIHRYLRNDHLTPRLVWENGQHDIPLSPHGYLVFDAPVLDKNFRVILTWFVVNIVAMPKPSSQALAS